MGAVKRLVDDGAFQSIDLLTSVSGGGYVAYYVYQKAFDQMIGKPQIQGRAVKFSDWFVDARLECNGKDSRGNCIPPTFETRDLKRGFMRSNLDCSVFPQYASSSQKWVACYQDLFSNSPGGNYWTLSGFPLSSYVGGTLGTVASLPFHHAANTLFDLGLQTSPSQAMYLSGILRTYGTTTLGPGTPEARRLSYADLASLYEREPSEVLPRLPYWVVQATSAISTSSWFDIQDKPYDLDDAVFELGPYGFGSDAYGHVFNASPSVLDDRFDVAQSILASAAFLDPAQRLMKMNRGVVFLGLHTLNLKWGVRLPNYNVDDRDRTLHSLLPFPFYYAHAFRADPKNPYIRLSDGGQNGDNLGVYAQLQRGVRNIISIDGAMDLDEQGRSSLPELCTVDDYLRRKHRVRLVFRGSPESDSNDLTEFDVHEHCSTPEHQRDVGLKACESPTDPSCRPSPYEWKRKVWVGTVRAIDGVPPREMSPLGRVLTDVDSPTRIFYVKAAIDYESVMSLAQSYYRNGKTCTSVAGEDSALPCGLLYYMGGTERIVSSPRYKGRRIFPQSSTVEQTADSNRQAYNAYLDLGWFVTGGLCEQPELRSTSLCAKDAASPAQDPTTDRAR